MGVNISKEYLDALITSQKQFKTFPRREMASERQFMRNEFEAYAPILDESFHVFMRQSIVFLENYSIGLVWNRKNDKPVILFRCNGPHGGNENSSHRFVTHIHRLNLEEAAVNRFVETDTKETEEYTTFEDAAWFFLSYCGFRIEEIEKYFPFLRRMNLFGK